MRGHAALRRRGRCALDAAAADAAAHRREARADTGSSSSTPAAFTRSRQDPRPRAATAAGALTRPPAYEALERGGVSPAGQRGIHIVGHLAQQGLICFGPREGEQPTFVLLEDWVPAAGRTVARGGAGRARHARTSRSHGPATLRGLRVVVRAAGQGRAGGDRGGRARARPRDARTAGATGRRRGAPAATGRGRRRRCCRRGTSTSSPTRIARPRSAISGDRRARPMVIGQRAGRHRRPRRRHVAAARCPRVRRSTITVRPLVGASTDGGAARGPSPRRRALRRDSWGRRSTSARDARTGARTRP